jgi:hypothetical protein
MVSVPVRLRVTICDRVLKVLNIQVNKNAVPRFITKNSVTHFSLFGFLALGCTWDIPGLGMLVFGVIFDIPIGHISGY